MRPEEKIEKRFVTECFKLGVKSEKLLRKNKKGWPDQSVFLPLAILLLVEFKVPGEEPDVHQCECHKELRALGFRVIVADNWEMPLQIVKTYLGK